MNSHENDINHYDLNDFIKVESLGGGTGSTYLLTNPEQTQQQVVLKFGAHIDAMKIEILCNAIYQTLGVAIPANCVHRTLPNVIANKLKLLNKNGIFQISEYLIADQSLANKQIIINDACRHFLIYALMGNIDIAKEENFIVCKGIPYLIDAGANFIFRSLGGDRIEMKHIITEIDSLRNAKINKMAALWFKPLTDTELKIQAEQMVEKWQKIEAVLWETAAEIDLPFDLFEIFLNTFSDRWDNLILRFCPHYQIKAKIDRKANSTNTAAGIFTYSIINGEICGLFGKRIRHHYYDIPGGGSHPHKDIYLHDTAIRETHEESGLLYTKHTLHNAPSHDFITLKEENHTYFLYRMYLLEGPSIDPNKIKDEEHSEFQWIPLSYLQSALKENNIIIVEGQKTIALKIPNQKTSIILFPPFYRLLQTDYVQKNLQLLLQNKPLSKTHTQSIDANFSFSPNSITARPINSPFFIRDQLSNNLLNYSQLLREFKAKTKKLYPEKTLAFQALSQSELHIKAVLGKDYQENHLINNLTLFLTNHCRTESMVNLNSEKREKLIYFLADLIIKEKEGGNENLYFYHACDNKVSFAYSVYTLLYEILHANPSWQIFRASQQHFQAFPTIQDFIAHYSDYGKKEINNNDKGYSNCGLSANFFVLGNHIDLTSFSIEYLLKNKSMRDLDLSALLKDLFQPFSVPDHEINLLLEFYKTHIKQENASLYQISIPKDKAAQLAYPSIILGKLISYKGLNNLNDILTQLEIDLSLSEDNQDYRKAKAFMEILQIRLFLPPNEKIEVYKSQWNTFDTKTPDKKKIILENLLNQVVYSMLSHANELNMDVFDKNLSLFRLLPSIYETNQLMNQPVNEALLARAIINNNFPLVKKIFEKYPHMKKNEICFQKNHIAERFSNHANQPESKLLPIIIMIKFSNFSAESMLSLYGDHWWQERDIDTFKDGESIILLLKKIPNEYKLSYLMEKLKNKNLSLAVYDLLSIQELLPENDKLLFAIETYSLIRNGKDLSLILSTLPPNQRLSFFNSSIKNTPHYFYSKITNGTDLAKVLTVLPKEIHLDLANKFQSKIQCCMELGEVVSTLFDEDKLIFTEKCSKIFSNKNSKDFAFLLEKFSDKQARLILVEKYSSCINFRNIAPILNCLEENERYPFILKYKESIRITNISDILQYLPNNHRLEFVFSQPIHTFDLKTIFTLTKKLNAADKITFLIKSNKINSVNSLLAALDLLSNAHDEMTLIQQYGHFILNLSDLNKLVDTLSSSNHLSIVKQFFSIIKNDQDFISIMYLLTPQDRLQLVKDCQKQINNQLCTFLLNFSSPIEDAYLHQAKKLFTSDIVHFNIKSQLK